MPTRHRQPWAPTFFPVLILLAIPAYSDWYESFRLSVKEGQSTQDFRLRNEVVSADTFRDNARATTLRSRFTWTSGDLGSWTYAAEADYVLVVGAERYNSLANGRCAVPDNRRPGWPPSQPGLVEAHRP